MKSITGYVEATYDIRSDLALVADVRYTRDEKSDRFAFAPSPFGAVIIGPAQSANPSKDFYRRRDPRMVAGSGHTKKTNSEASAQSLD